MVVAPAYLLHPKLEPILPFFSFGVAEYTFQAFLLLLTVILLKKFRLSYLFSFVTALLYGAFLDLFIGIIGYIPHESLAVRIIFFALGVVICSFAVSLFFIHTFRLKSTNFLLKKYQENSELQSANSKQPTTVQAVFWE